MNNMKYKFFNYLVFLSASLFLLNSCIKNEVTDLGDSGKTLLKFQEAPENQIFFSPFSDTRPVSLFSLRRDVNSQNELNKSATVTVKFDAAGIARYNTAHGSNFERLPDSLFTLGQSFTKTGTDTYSATFGPGEFAKEFIINLNGAKWDLSKRYAFPVTILDPGGLTISTDKEEVIPLVSIKNQWDGIYSVVAGTVTRYTSPGVPAGDNLSGSLVGNPDVVLSTVGPTTVEISNHKWANTNPLGVAGIDNLRATIDPVTNLVTMRALGNASLANWEGKPNYYDPATKTFYLAFKWNPTGATREYEIVLKYKGPR